MTKFELHPTGPIGLVGRLRASQGSRARANLAAAQQLAKGLRPLQSEGSSFFVPLAFLAAQATESGLKAFLAETLSARQLKDLGHDILALWGAAHAAGLPISPTPPTSIQNLAQLHKRPYPLRYAQDSLVIIAATNLEALCADVEALLAVVATALN